MCEDEVFDKGIELAKCGQKLKNMTGGSDALKRVMLLNQHGGSGMAYLLEHLV